MFFRKDLKTASPQPKKQSLFGLLFNPQLGPAISPLRESTRVFLQLLASVFAIYKLLPKNYPGLRDPEAHLSLSRIIGDAWQNVQLTREGAPRAILFFAVVSLMAFSAIMAISALLSIFVGHAHAADTSMFTSPSTNDLAQNWLNYLFIAPTGGGGATYPTATDTYGSMTASLEDPFSGSISLQNAIMNALGYYSDAILVIAAIILFYHLAAMVVETAHHGVPMGKQASQIWAPIRLVVAVGLLVPVNGGLNCGQYIVIKVAEMGSGLASNVWSQFLTKLAQYSGTAIPPSSQIVTKIATDMINMQACQISWHTHLTAITNAGLSSLSNADIPSTPTQDNTPLGKTPGTRFHYSSNSLEGLNICGWYFLPSGGNTDGSVNTNALLQQAAKAQSTALTTSNAGFTKAAGDIQAIIQNPGTPPQVMQSNTDLQDAIAGYQKNLNDAMASLATQQTNSVTQAVQTITPYGWVMAGTFLNAVDRVQADLSSAARDTMPTTAPPTLMFLNIADMTGAQYDLFHQVYTDMVNFDGYESLNQYNQSNKADASCAAMIGLGESQVAHAHSNDIDKLFEVIDNAAVNAGVWSSGNGTPCGNIANHPTTFKLGVQINGRDPFAQMAALGYANLDTAFELAEGAVGGGALVSAIKAAMTNASKNGSSITGNTIEGIGGSVASIALFAALIFFVCGFTLAFLVPLMPFMRFFFAVLAWVAAIVEAIVEIPLVALAHLSPEGEGLPGPAKGAYFFVFNLFLRPVLTVFGLICGLVLFLISVSFLNYGYAIGVSGIGGSTYGLASMAKLIYSVLYVVILYISANHCFMLIDHLPEHALRWMGQSGQSIPKMGDTGQVEQYGAAAGAYFGQKGMSQAQDAANKLGAGIGGAIGGGAKGMTRGNYEPGSIIRDSHGNARLDAGGNVMREPGRRVKGGLLSQGAALAGVGALGYEAYEHMYSGSGHGAASGETIKNLSAISHGAQQANMDPKDFMQDSAKMRSIGLNAITNPNDVKTRAADIDAIRNQDTPPPPTGGANASANNATQANNSLPEVPTPKGTHSFE